MDIRKLQRVIVDGLEDVKAQHIAVFNTEHLSALFERVIIASGTSNRQTKSLASSVREAVKDAGYPVPRMEGEANGEWIIIDCGAAVVHVMQPSIREYYHLEEIWGDKPVNLKLGAAARKLVKAEEHGEGASASSTSRSAAGKTVIAKRLSKADQERGPLVRLARTRAARSTDAEPIAPERPVAGHARNTSSVEAAPALWTAPARKRVGAATATNTDTSAPARKRAVPAAAKDAPARKTPARKRAAPVSAPADEAPAHPRAGSSSAAPASPRKRAAPTPAPSEALPRRRTAVVDLGEVPSAPRRPAAKKRTSTPVADPAVTRVVGVKSATKRPSAAGKTAARSAPRTPTPAGRPVVVKAAAPKAAPAAAKKAPARKRTSQA